MLQRFAPILVFAIVQSLAGWIAPAHAQGMADGVAWLNGTQSAEGYWDTPSGPRLRDTATVTISLRTLDPSSPPAARAMQWLDTTAPITTDYLARWISALVGSGRNLTAALNELNARQGLDGGFGIDLDHRSGVLDTALALQTFASTQTTSGTSATVGFLLGTQQTNGAWLDSGGESSVFLTAHTMRALWYYRHIYVGVPAALAAAQNYLLAQRGGSGLWAEHFNSALALIAIIPNLPNLSAVNASITALQAAQLPNGSWDNDAYTTALALQALYLASLPQPNPDFVRIQGKVVDALTGLPLSGVTVALSGAATASVVTASDGLFLFKDLPAGNYSL
jgi:hypothetical protein